MARAALPPPVTANVTHNTGRHLWSQRRQHYPNGNRNGGRQRFVSLRRKRCQLWLALTTAGTQATVNTDLGILTDNAPTGSNKNKLYFNASDTNGDIASQATTAVTVN